MHFCTPTIFVTSCIRDDIVNLVVENHLRMKIKLSLSTGTEKLWPKIRHFLFPFKLIQSSLSGAEKIEQRVIFMDRKYTSHITIMNYHLVDPYCKITFLRYFFHVNNKCVKSMNLIICISMWSTQIKIETGSSYIQ